MRTTNQQEQERQDQSVYELQSLKNAVFNMQKKSLSLMREILRINSMEISLVSSPKIAIVRIDRKSSKLALSVNVGLVGQKRTRIHAYNKSART